MIIMTLFILSLSMYALGYGIGWYFGYRKGNVDIEHACTATPDNLNPVKTDENGHKIDGLGKLIYDDECCDCKTTHL